jgi:hypothetical protein
MYNFLYQYHILDNAFFRTLVTRSSVDADFPQL